MTLKIVFLILGLYVSIASANDRFLKLVIQDGSKYWVTLQSTDDRAGIIILTNGERLENSKEEYPINTIRHLNYLIPYKKGGGKLTVSVYASNKKDKVIAQADLIQDNDAGWIVKLVNPQGKQPLTSDTIPDSRIDLSIRVKVNKEGIINLLTT